MIPISHTVTDTSQLKLHVQDDGVALSWKEGEWVLLANQVAEALRDKLNIIYTSDFEDDSERGEEEDYEISYILPGSEEPQRVSFKATSEMEAMLLFYENAPAEYKAQLTKVEVTKKS